MKNLIIFLSILALFSHSCTKEPDEPDPNGEPSDNQSVLQADIGSEGGKLETEDFVLTVPEGAFETTVTLKLTPIENDPDASSNQVTGSYRLTGLNCAWSKPLEFKIRYEGTPEGESYIALGFKYYDIELEDSILVDEFIEAVDSSGFLTCTLSPLEAPESVAKSAPLSTPLYHPVAFHSYLVVRGIFNKGSFQSECAYVQYDKTFNYERSKVEQFAQYMDEAVYFFHTMGLMDKNIFQGLYKLKVSIVETPTGENYPTFVKGEFEGLDVFTQESQYKILTLVYSIKIPASFFDIADNKQMRKVAGEGVFRYINYCYFREARNWLQWASIFWVQEYFYGSKPETKTDPFRMLMQPFHGMNVNNMEEYLDVFPLKNPLVRDYLHGEGMAPVIKYLLENYNDDLDLLAKMFNELRNPLVKCHPIDAILKSVDTPENIWWPGFFKEYLTGGIWDIPAEEFLEKVDFNDEVHFIDKTDTVKYFDRSYADLSAKLCQVNLSSSLAQYVLNEGDRLNFKLGLSSLNLDYVSVIVYSIKDGQLNLLGEGTEVTINNVKSLIDNGVTTLLAVVVNSASESPYMEEMNIELTIRMIGKRSWPWKYVTIDAIVTDAIFSSNSGGNTSWDELSFEVTDQLLEVSEDGSWFTANWLDQSDYYKYEGTIEITVDTLTYEITGFYLWSNSESITNGEVTLSEEYEIVGKENLSIPLVYSGDDYLTHQVSGEEVCSLIANYSYEYRMYPGKDYEYNNILESYNCNEDANILFFWARELEEKK